MSQEDALRAAEVRIAALEAELDRMRQEREAALGTIRAGQRSEQLAHAILDSAPGAILLLDREGHLLAANTPVARGFNRSPQEMIGVVGYDLLQPELARTRRARIEEVFATGRPVRFEDERNGRTFENNIYPVLDAQGRVENVAVIGLDVTDVRRAEASLRESEERYRALAEAERDFVFVIDREDVVLYANGVVAALFRTRPEDLFGHKQSEFFPPEIAERHRRALESVIASGVAVRRENQVSLPAIGAAWTDTFLCPLRNAAGEVCAVLGVARDITERKRVEAEREELLLRERAACAEAQEANAAKDRFLAVLSHELRNPLTPVLAGLHIVRRLLPETPRARSTLEVMERNVRLQARLIDDLLDLSRIRRDKLTLERVPLALAPIVEAAVDALQADLERGGLRLVKSLERAAWVLGDPDRIQQIVLNLLSNAVKFTPAGGEVRVSLGAERDRAQIAVEDTGIGIESSLMPHLFEMFRQGETGERRKGLGIGLALVKQLAELHGGSVRAESAGPGKGARFAVLLPTVEPPAVSEARATARTRRQYTVLIVEDEPDARSLLMHALALEGYRVLESGSGEEALAQLEGSRPDVILADIGLPGMNGCEFLRRAREAGADMPAFAVTGFGQSEDVKRTKEVGFAGHFVKPVDVAEIDQRIRAHLEP